MECIKIIPLKYVQPRSIINKTKFTNSIIVQELCESRGGRPGLSVLTSLWHRASALVTTCP